METKTQQEQFWAGEFGKDYTDRNAMTPDDWDKFYRSTWGHTKIEMNEKLISSLPKDIKILEVGCNIGQQLLGFQRMGFKNLYGIELQHYAVENAKKNTQNINIIQGSGFDLPFRDGFFDLVCTNGVLIHIHPADLPKIMTEIYRCSGKYIMGFEYYAKDIQDINYRGNKEYLWKGDYAATFIKNFPDLKLIRQDLYPYITEVEKGNCDSMYLLEKK